MRAVQFTFLCSVSLLGGCATLTKGGAGKPDGTAPAEAVIREVKQDLGSYFAYQAQAAQAPAQQNPCGGKVNFNVTAVTVNLTTVTKITNEGTAEAEVPIGGVTLGPSGSYSRSGKSSQSLSFTLVPADNVAAGDLRSPRPNSFDAVLRSLRESMLRASDTPPCFKFPDPKDQDNSIEFGFTVTRDSSAGGKISFLIFSLGATHSRSREAAHTVTVKFQAAPDTMLTPPP